MMHIDTNDINIHPEWPESKDEIWKEAFTAPAPEAARVRRRSFWRYAAAAAVLVLATSGAFACLYTTTETAARGMHVALTLPDGSNVQLNAESELTYKPYWWFASRKVRLKGEAYFEVQPGSRFAVWSGAGEVRVLGTRFNVFSRAGQYSVTCLSGKVEVAAAGGHVLLRPNMQAALRNGALEVTGNTDAVQAAGWTHDRFHFTGVPLADVVREIERQYDIRVTSASSLDQLYTGHFSKTKEPGEVLQIIGKPFGITFSIEP